MNTSYSMYKDPLTEELEQFNFNLVGFHFWQRKEQAIFNEIPTNYKVLVVVAGQGKITYHNVDYYFTKGDVILLSPYTMYTTHFIEKEPCELYQIYFDVLPEKKRKLFSQLFRCNGVVLYPRLINERVFPMIAASYRNIQQRRSGCNFSGKLVLLHLLLNMLQHASNSRSDELATTKYTTQEASIVRSCMEYLDRHMNVNVHVSDLCTYLDISQSYLFKCFQKVFNLSTKEFLLVYRFRQIELELAQTNRSIQEISDRFGYPSVYAFSKAFKTRYNISPLKYRQSCQTGSHHVILEQEE